MLDLAGFLLMASAVQWQRFETAATADPAVFTGPKGQRIEAPAFDGKARVAFPVPGKWTWQGGSVDVKPYTGTNPLYRHGFLKPAGRYLAHADGTPFLWMGDTAWYAGAKATPEEWRDYVADRASKKFSVVQISAVRGPVAAAGEPFASNGTPNEAYWAQLDVKVAQANERGIVVFIVGLGRPSNPAHEAFVVRPEFARYVAARFYGDHVIFSPNFDGAYKPSFDTVASNLRKATALHLITQHPNTQKGQNEIYADRDYLSFHGLQSGHHIGKLENTYGAAREWPQNLWRLEPVKPVINIEGMYDGRGNDEGNGWREKDVRKIGWISWLSGALGYTYGAGETDRKVPGTHGGIWGWNQDASQFDYWRKVASWPSSKQMTVMRDFFASIEWWRLEPAHGLVTPEPAVFALASDRSFAVAYSPVRQKLVIDMSRFQGPVRGEWVDPVTGHRIPVAGTIPNIGTHEFVMPEGGEDQALWLRVAHGTTRGSR